METVETPTISYPVMRTPRESLLILGLLTTACLLAGVFLGLWMGVFVPSPIRTPTPHLLPRTATSSPPAEVSILLLGVDSLRSPSPTLEAIWVLRFELPESNYYLIGFSPQTIVDLAGLGGPQTVAYAYQMDRKLGMGESRFTKDMLGVILKGLVRPQAEIVFDQQMLATTVDRLGGIQLYGANASGQVVLAQFDAIAPDDAAGRLAFQYDALNGLTKAAAAQYWAPESVRPFLKLGQEFISVDGQNYGWFSMLLLAKLPFDSPPTFTITETLPSGVVTPTP